MLLVTACGEQHEITENGVANNGCNVRMVIGTNPMLPATRAYSTTERSIDEVTSYHLLFYKYQQKADGSYEHLLAKRIYKTIDANSQYIEDVIALEEGKWKGYIVANLPEDGLPNCTIGTGESYLWNQEMSWDNSAPENNNVMFGFFTKVEDTPGNDLVTDLDNSIDEAINLNGLHKVNPTDHKAPEIEIVSTTIQAKLTAKLYRMAAMITLYFYTKELDPSVTLQINSVKIYNIPNQYILWNNSARTNENGVSTDELTEVNQTIKRNIINYDDNIERRNTHSLGKHFYVPENRQGTIETSELNNKTAGSGGAKEKATYIEVVATHNKLPDGETVTYRYAIGEDSYGDNGKIVYNNYNVTRNRHYKVYLTLKGYALNEATESLWKTQLSEGTTTSYSPFVEVTGDKVRLVNYDGTTIKAASWSVSNSNTWLHIRKAKAISNDDKEDGALKFETGITGDANSNVEFYYFNANNSYNIGNITITYDGKEITQQMKSMAVYKYKENGTNYDNTDFVEPAGTGELPVYHNVYVSKSNWKKDDIVSLQLYHGITESTSVEDGYINSFNTSFQFRWPGSWIYNKVTHDKDDDRYKGTARLDFKSYIRYNGYYEFDLWAKNYIPERFTILKNAPITTASNDTMTFASGVAISSNSDRLTLTNNDASNNAFGTESKDDFAPTINSTLTKDYLHIKNTSAYVDYKNVSVGSTIYFVARGLYESDNRMTLYKVDGNETETEVKSFTFKAEHHVRPYSYTVPESGNYRIKCTGGEVYLYYAAI